MKRTYLTSREHDALLQGQNGMCCVPGCFETDGLIAEHSTPNAIYPGKPDQLMCRPCHKVKTLRDVKAIAKLKRLNGTTMSLNRQRANHERLRQDGALLSPRPIPSRLPQYHVRQDRSGA